MFIHPFRITESQTPRAFHSPLMTTSFDTWNTVRIRIGVDHWSKSQSRNRRAAVVFGNDVPKTFGNGIPVFGTRKKTPRKVPWNPNLKVWKMIFLFKMVIFRFHMLVFGGVSRGTWFTPKIMPQGKQIKRLKIVHGILLEERIPNSPGPPWFRMSFRRRIFGHGSNL